MSSRTSTRAFQPAGKERSTDAHRAQEAQSFWPEAPTAKAPVAPPQREWCRFGDAPPDRADLEARILNALYWDLAVPSDHLSVTLERGWVTISGAVAYSYQKSCAEADVRRVSGVRGVTNAIEIEIESTGSNAAGVPCP